MKLSTYAKKLGLNYRTVWNWYRDGRIPGAYQTETGTVLVPEETPVREEYTAVYSRVSSSMNKSNLVSQSKRVQDFCSARGWVVNRVVEECDSGLNDQRPKLMKLLADPSVTRIVTEHRDRLTRFGYHYIDQLWSGELVVVNEVVEDEEDLMQDFVSLVTSFTARLYGRRRSKRATEKLIKELKDSTDDSPIL